MSRFLNSFIAEQMEDGVHWKLTKELQLEDEVLGVVIVPQGFETDGGSVPPIAQGFVNPYGKGFKAFVVHDYLYSIQTHPREACDECLKRALSACGENWFDSAVQFEAVRSGGESAWKEDQIKYGLKK